MAIEKETKIRVTAKDDASPVLKGISGSFLEFNAALDVVNKGFAVASQAWQVFSRTIERGQALVELSDAFKNLYGSTTQLAVNGIGKLTEATGGLLSQVDLLKSANLAASAGLSANQFLEIASAAETLGDAVGQDLKTALDGLTFSISAGNERALKQYGILIDNAKAEKEFAASIGTTADKLNEVGKREALRIAALAEIQKKLKEAGSAEITAGDALERLAASINTQIDKAASAVVKNKELTQAITSMGDAIADLPVDKVVSFFGTVIEWGKNAVVALAPIPAAILQIRDALKEAAGSEDEQIAALVKKREEKQKEIAEFLSQSKGMQSLNNLLGMSGGENLLQQMQSQLDETQSALAAKLENKFNPSIKESTDLVMGMVTGLVSYDTNLKLNSEFINDNAGDLKKHAEEVANETQAIKQLRAEMSATSSENFLDTAIKNVDQASFGKYFQEFATKLKAATREAIDAQYKYANEATKEALVNEAMGPKLTAKVQEFGENLQDKADDFGEKLKDNIQASADFFTDAFYNAMTGASFDLQDMLKRVLAGVAGGAMGQLFPGMGGAGNLQGMGQQIGGSLISSVMGGGSGGFLSSIFGSGGATMASTELLPGAAGAAGGEAYAAASAGATAGVSAGLAAAGPAIAAAAALYVGNEIYGGTASGRGADGRARGFGGGFSAGMREAPTWMQAYGLGLAPFTFGASMLPLVGRGLMGGIAGATGGSQDAEEYARRAARTAVDEMTSLDSALTYRSFTSGTQRLTQRGYELPVNADGSYQNAMGGDAINLFSGLGDLFSGGGKAGDQLANIFAGGALEGAERFNDVLANGLALLDQMDITAEDAKNGIKDLFLDGKLSLEEFGNDIQGLNLLAQENLVGTGSVSDALSLLARNFDNPRAQLHAFELMLGELAEIGITSLSDIGNYLAQTFGPDAVDVFNRIQQSGVTSFDDLSGQSADSIFMIMSALQSLKDELYTTFNISDEAAAVSEGAKKMARAIYGVGVEAESARKKIMALGKAATTNQNLASGGTGLNANPA